MPDRRTQKDEEKIAVQEPRHRVGLVSHGNPEPRIADGDVTAVRARVFSRVGLGEFGG